MESGTGHTGLTSRGTSQGWEVSQPATVTDPVAGRRLPPPIRVPPPGTHPAPRRRIVPEGRRLLPDLIGASRYLLIEQFATVALGLANRAHLMEGGWICFSGQAGELRDNPARLRSAYLLRGSSPSIPNEAGIPPRSASS